MSRFDRTSQQLALARRSVPLDQDVRDTRVLEAVDVFYVSTDPDIEIVAGTPALAPLLNYQDVRRQTTFDNPFDLFATEDPELNGGFYEHQVFPVLRHDEQGVLRWRFGSTLPVVSLGRTDPQGSFNLVGARELLILETTRVILKAAGDGSEALVSVRLSAVGPGGVAGLGGNANAQHHHLMAHALYREPAAGPPPQNRVVLFNVLRATGFWARATNVSVIMFDDPAHPNFRTREVSVLRGATP